jgi:hypothetical protein
MSNHDDLQPDLRPVIDELRAHRPEATALELDAIKQRVRTRVSNPARRRTRRAELMKSRLVILTTLVLGTLLSTTGAGLAITNLNGSNDASVSQYGPPRQDHPSGGGGGVLGAEDEGGGSGVAPAEEEGGAGEGSGVQPTRQAEAGADAGGELPFTGFAAIPILLGGIALLSAGLVLRRRSGEST